MLTSSAVKIGKGEARLEFSRRLGTTYRELAMLLDIPHYTQDQFRQGMEANEIWRFMEERKILVSLPEKLHKLGRKNLAELMARALRPEYILLLQADGIPHAELTASGDLVIRTKGQSLVLPKSIASLSSSPNRGVDTSTAKDWKEFHEAFEEAYWTIREILDMMIVADSSHEELGLDDLPGVLSKVIERLERRLNKRPSCLNAFPALGIFANLEPLLISLINRAVASSPCSIAFKDAICVVNRISGLLYESLSLSDKMLRRKI